MVSAGINYGCFDQWTISLLNAGYDVKYDYQCASRYFSARGITRPHKVAKIIHQLNFPSIPFRLDDQDHVDIIVGSPTCTGLSAGNPRRSTIHPANQNFVEFHRYIAEVRPKYYMLEIVPQILKPIGLPVLEEALAQVSRDYIVQWHTFDIEYYGSPSRRQRTYFLGAYKDSYIDPHLLESLPKRPMVDCYSRIADLEDTYDHYNPDGRILESREDKKGKLRPGPFSILLKTNRVVNEGEQFPTITSFSYTASLHKSPVSHYGTGKHRFFAIPEIARLMGFPDSFTLKPPGRRWTAGVYCNVIASGVQIDFTTYLLKYIKPYIV